MEKINKTSAKIKELKEEISIPKGIDAVITEKELSLKKGDKEIKRKINPVIDLEIQKDKIILNCKRARKTEKKIFGTINAHINNMIEGLENGFRYKLQISNVHFPMNVSYDKANNLLIIKNFLGEKTDRKIKLMREVEFNIDKDIIELSSFDIEKAGQCAANIEKGTRVRNKDRRIFQDGIFIIKKPKRSFM